MFCAVVVVAFGCGNGGLSTINIKAFYDPGLGGPRPIAKTYIYLLNNSIASPEMEAALKAYLAANPQPVNPTNPKIKSEIGTRAGFMKGEGEKIWSKYVVDKFETHDNGTGKFRQVKAGEYWIYCSRPKVNGEVFIWNVKTRIDFYESINVTISNDNVAFQ